MVQILVKVDDAGVLAGIEFQRTTGDGEKEATPQTLLNSPTLYQLPDNFNLKNKILKARKLDTEQSVLFFDYLRQLGVIGNYENSSLAKFVHFLTGWSEKCLSMDFSSNFREIRRFKKGKPSVENLESVRDMLAEMMAIVNTDIETEKKKVQGTS